MNAHKICFYGENMDTPIIRRSYDEYSIYIKKKDLFQPADYISYCFKSFCFMSGKYTNIY